MLMIDNQNDKACSPARPGSAGGRIPKLRVMRDSHPMTGQIWVVDENNHHVASFSIKRQHCHLAGATEEVMDVGRNMVVAEALIEHLYSMWDVERCQPNDKPRDAAP